MKTITTGWVAIPIGGFERWILGTNKGCVDFTIYPTKEDAENNLDSIPFGIAKQLRVKKVSLIEE